MTAANWTGSLKPSNRYRARLAHAYQGHKGNIRKFTYQSNKHFTSKIKKTPGFTERFS